MSAPTKGSAKLAYILDAFPEADAAGKICADLGCNVGGFTHELLRRQAARVFAIDTGYGALEWGLRKDPRVSVHERKNALHADWLRNLDLVVSDLAWTRQEKILPKVFTYIHARGVVFSLLKPQYEAENGRSRQPVLDDAEAHTVAGRIFAQAFHPPTHTVHLRASPLRGKEGNLEFWLVFLPAGEETSKTCPIPCP